MERTNPRGLASLVGEDELDADLIIPSVFDRGSPRRCLAQAGLFRLVESG